MPSAEVVVIGGGVIGASIAYHLAAKGCPDVLVLERAAGFGLGSTGKATGGIRAQFSSAIHVRLSILARQKLLRFAEELGVDPGYRPCGYLFLARRQEDLAPLLAAQAVQHAAGLLEAQAVDQSDIRRLQPQVRAEDFAGGVFCPVDGFLKPLEILRGYAEGARRLGVRFETGLPCTGFRMSGASRIEAVFTPRGAVEGSTFVNAAGAWAAQVARMAGVEIPVTPLRRQLALSEPTGLLPADMPMTIFAEDWVHLRVRDGGVLLGWPDEPLTEDPFDDRLDEAWLSEVVRRARERVPCLWRASFPASRAWGGLYEVSPDRHALLGPAPGVANFYLANGASGHGVMHSPALGQLLAEIVLDGSATTLEVEALRPSRFAEGRPNPVPELL